MQRDVAIVGAGPAGLAFARSLRGSGLTVALIERQPRAALEDPAFDGREIALTQRSIGLLRDLGAWREIPADAVWPLRAARVLNGASPLALRFEPEVSGAGRGRDQAGSGALGALVANHHLRRALFRLVDGARDVTLLDGVGAMSARRDGEGFCLGLPDGATLDARLLVVADSRFSTTRDQIGVGVEMNRLGRSMLVCRMSHPADHGQVATEWFDHGQTLAALPLGPGQSSIVITLAAPEIDRLAALDAAAFEAEMTLRHGGRLGALRLASTRHVYPLVTTWSQRFSGGGFALIGDAAVGMHPVTAHGFNLGLRGQACLARVVLAAHAKGRGVGAAETLAAYEREHWRACLPLYAATNLLARLYATETPPARLVRHAVLRLGRQIGPARRLVTRSLMAS
jgi:ubiquinone biosynthesis UbiH/UbiF/VisC/COQ6 family hydroxylase